MEVHVCGSTTFRNVFSAVTYNFVLCLTGTLERLDGKEEIIKKYAPVCDTISMQEALANGWVSPVKQYVVLLDVDLTEYKELDRKFNARFAIFNWDYALAMDCLTSWKRRNSYAKEIGSTPKEILAASADWMRSLQKRKVFIASHPKKIEICKKILQKRSDKKIITFSSTIADANKIGCDYILHSKQKKKENLEILKKFNEASCGSIASSKALNTGVDVKGLSVGIIMDVNSSKIKAGQQLGRVCRFEPGKTAEVFTLIIKNTQEQKWFANSSMSDVVFITEEQLDDVLDGKEVSTRKREFAKDLKYRF